MVSYYSKKRYKKFLQDLKGGTGDCSECQCESCDSPLSCIEKNPEIHNSVGDVIIECEEEHGRQWKEAICSTLRDGIPVQSGQFHDNGEPRPSEEVVRRYIDLMRQPNAWAGQLEIQSVSNLLNINIQFVTSRGNVENVVSMQGDGGAFAPASGTICIVKLIGHFKSWIPKEEITKKHSRKKNRRTTGGCGR